MIQRSIGIDGYNLSMRNGTGVATYGYSLARSLRRNGFRTEGVFGLDVGQDIGLSEVLFFDKLLRPEPTNKTRKQINAEQRRLWRKAFWRFAAPSAIEVPLTDRVEKTAFADRLPLFDRLVSSPDLFEVAFRYFRRHGRFLRLRMNAPPDIMHWTYPVPVSLEGAANVYTVHDLVPLRLPYTTLDTKAAYADIVQACARSADHICTVSEASKTDIVQTLGIAEDRVTNTYQYSSIPENALHADPAVDAAMIKGIFGLEARSYFLFFGAIEPKKNVGRLLEAHLSMNSGTRLVIVGARAWQSEDELRLLPAAGSPSSLYGDDLSNRVGRLDYLPRPLLLRLIRSARAVVFPSLYEGFGLPVLEAMQLGTPVLTSSTSSLPEIAGDAALLVDPYDVNAIAEGLRALDVDAELRTRLSAAGLAQAAKFSEANYVGRLTGMYEAVLSKRQAA